MEFGNNKKNYNLRPEIIKKFNYNSPTVIITAGPTGSGKSLLLSKSLEILYKNRIAPIYKTFLIDDYVDNSKMYKEIVNSVIDKFNCNENTSPGSKCDILNPNPELVKELDKAYFEVRENGPCDDSGKSCKELYNIDIINAIKNSENILIETTGKNIPLKYINTINTITQNSGLPDYNFLFVYSILDFEPLIDRVKSRFKNSMNSYLNNKLNSAPRLPNVSRDIFKQKSAEIIKKLIKLRNVCMRLGRPTDIECGPINSKGNFVLFIFDNNTMPSKLIYDSRSNDVFMTNSEFITLLQSYGLEGGKGKTTRRKNNLKRKTKRK